MKPDLPIEDLLQREAENVSVDPALPAGVRQRIRRRQGVLLGAAALSVVALFLTAGTLFVDEPVELPPAVDDKASTTQILERGNKGGVKWQLELRSSTDKRERIRRNICVVAERTDNCWDLGERNRYGDAAVVVGYVRPLDSAIVVVEAPKDVGVTMREIPGPVWAALIASQSDPGSDVSYYYRLFAGPSVRGIVAVDVEGVPALEFTASIDGPTTSTGLSVTTEFPELRGFPGEKELLGTGTEGGGFTVVQRVTDEELCLHINDEFRCVDRDEPVQPIRLWVDKVLPCTADDACSGKQLTVITGWSSPEVMRIGIRDSDGISFTHSGDAYGEDIFVITIDGLPEADTELVVFDFDDKELAAIPLAP